MKDHPYPAQFDQQSFFCMGSHFWYVMMVASSFNQIVESHERVITNLYGKLLTQNTTDVLVFRSLCALKNGQLPTDGKLTPTVQSEPAFRTCLDDMTNDEDSEYIM